MDEIDEFVKEFARGLARILVLVISLIVLSQVLKSVFRFDSSSIANLVMTLTSAEIIASLIRG